jgi:hypothetical protein
MMVTTNTDVTAIELCCGHTVYLSDDFIAARRRDHKTWYCSTCGSQRHWPQKSDIEMLRGQLASTQDMLNTVRADRDRKEYSRRAEKAAKTRIKNRISKGVCPCCNRTFQDLQRHMTTKHPDYATTE